MIRRATLHDAAACAEILREWIEETVWFSNSAPESASKTSMQNRINSGEVFVAVKDFEVVGFVSYREGYLDCLYLFSAQRNQGLGKALLAYAQKSGALSLWVLQQNHAARRFYARAGFAEVELGDGRDNEEGLPDVRLEWKSEARYG